MKKLFLIIASLSLSVSAFALTINPTGTDIEVLYGEPTDNIDGSPLVDLSHTNIHMATQSGDIIIATIPATSVSGGGQIDTMITIPAQIETSIWATAVDTSGNRSGQSNSASIDTLPPSAPN